MENIKINSLPKKNPGYFVFHGAIPKEGNKEKIKAQLRVRFDHHLSQFLDSISDDKLK